MTELIVCIDEVVLSDFAGMLKYFDKGQEEVKRPGVGFVYQENYFDGEGNLTDEGKQYTLDLIDNSPIINRLFLKYLAMREANESRH